MAKKPDPTNDGFEKKKAQFANLFGTFGANPFLEQAGVIVPYTLDDGTAIKFKLRRAGLRNTEWKRAYNRMVKPNEDRVLSGEITEDEMKGLLAVVYAEAVILGWEGIKDSDGKEVAYSKELAIELLQFFPDLFTLIINSAHSRSNYQETELERTEKN